MTEGVHDFLLNRAAAMRSGTVGAKGRHNLREINGYCIAHAHAKVVASKVVSQILQYQSVK
jgi:hypothetical protein